MAVPSSSFLRCISIIPYLALCLASFTYFTCTASALVLIVRSYLENPNHGSEPSEIWLGAILSTVSELVWVGLNPPCMHAIMIRSTTHQMVFAQRSSQHGLQATPISTSRGKYVLLLQYQ